MVGRLSSIVAAIAVAVPAMAMAKIPASISASEQQALQQSLDRGTLLHRYDQAAWHTTDALKAVLAAPRLDLIRGWVVTPEPTGERATYYGLNGDTPYLIYSAIWDGKAIVSSKTATEGANEGLTTQELALVKVLGAARRQIEGKPRCSQAPFNSVVLPGRTASDPVSVYFLTPQTSSTEYPYGGHYRIDVKDGRVVGERAFTKSCAAMPMPPKGKKAEAMVLTHLLDPVPTELHVFSVFNTGLPLYVVVPDQRLYSVQIIQGVATVRLVDRR